MNSLPQSGVRGPESRVHWLVVIIYDLLVCGGIRSNADSRFMDPGPRTPDPGPWQSPCYRSLPKRTAAYSAAPYPGRCREQ